MRRVRRYVISAALVSALVTLAVATVPALHLAYLAPRLRVVLETEASLTAIVAVFLVVGRLRRQARLNELLLTCALLLLALSSVVFALLPTLANGASRGVGAWDGRVGSVLGALLLAAASFAPARELKAPRRATITGLAIVVGVSASTASLVVLLHRHWGPGVDVAARHASAAWPDLHAHPALLALHLAGAVFFTVAALGFLRRAERISDPFFGWLAAASVFAAYSRFNYFLFPTRYTNWVYTGDGFRLLFYVVLLAGSMQEISSYWRSKAEAAVLEERRRIARDLHDGLAQELAYIDRNLAALEPLEGERGERLARLRRAATRAQIESRQALAALAAPANDALDIVFAQAVTEVADRFGAEVELDLVSGIRISTPRAECLLRIACEAVGNAAQHSGAQRIAVSLHRTGAALRLRVRDEGCGFDPTATTGGFGLVSMRERALAIGGRLRIDSTPQQGTSVELGL